MFTSHPRELAQAFYRSQSPIFLNAMRRVSNVSREASLEEYKLYMFEQYPTVEEIRTYFSNAPNYISVFKLNVDAVTNELEVNLLSSAPNFGPDPVYAYMITKCGSNVSVFEKEYILVEATNNSWYKSSPEEIEIRIDLEGELSLYDEGYNTNTVIDDNMAIDYFLDVKTYSEIIKDKNIPIQNFVSEASVNYFTKWYRSLENIKYGVSLLNLYLTINCYILGIKVPDEIKNVPFEGENNEDDFDDVYEEYVESTKDIRNVFFNKIQNVIKTF